MKSNWLKVDTGTAKARPRALVRVGRKFLYHHTIFTAFHIIKRLKIVSRTHSHYPICIHELLLLLRTCIAVKSKSSLSLHTTIHLRKCDIEHVSK